ncbi:uncharacterized protein LOC122435687 [Cervus canadensis]|uniref:uncharacterized protein LOC122435687 n=1 Tax=Cervus canadensis TaxID=1574408 RepID=UPI001CA327AD|nr:uncharacterized protein LOC122435687 [Cervus canadensis]
MTESPPTPCGTLGGGVVPPSQGDPTFLREACGHDPRSRRKPPPLLHPTPHPPRSPPRLAGEWSARTKEAGWKCGIRANLTGVPVAPSPADLKQRNLWSGVDEDKTVHQAALTGKPEFSYSGIARLRFPKGFRFVNRSAWLECLPAPVHKGKCAPFPGQFPRPPLPAPRGRCRRRDQQLQKKPFQITLASRQAPHPWPRDRTTVAPLSPTTQTKSTYISATKYKTDHGRNHQLNSLNADWTECCPAARGGEAGDTRTPGYKLTSALAAAPRRSVPTPPHPEPTRETDATRLGEEALQFSGQPHPSPFVPFTHSSANSKLTRQHFQTQQKNPGTREEEEVGGGFFLANNTADSQATEGEGREGGEGPASSRKSHFRRSGLLSAFVQTPTATAKLSVLPIVGTRQQSQPSRPEPRDSERHTQLPVGVVCRRIAARGSPAAGSWHPDYRRLQPKLVAQRLQLPETPEATGGKEKPTPGRSWQRLKYVFPRCGPPTPLASWKDGEPKERRIS